MNLKNQLATEIAEEKRTVITKLRPIFVDGSNLGKTFDFSVNSVA